MAQRTLFTIGHSTRGWDEFVALLRTWKIEEVVDVRTVPRSRAYPWFSKERMIGALLKQGVGYRHLPALGGFRRAKKASANSAWRNASFRGYADYMQTREFEKGLEELDRLRSQRRVCVMCSEALWWRCHRRMIADAEAARGVRVKHVMSETDAQQHMLSEFAVVKKRSRGVPVITYPGDASPTEHAGKQASTARHGRVEGRDQNQGCGATHARGEAVEIEERRPNA